MPSHPSVPALREQPTAWRLLAAPEWLLSFPKAPCKLDDSEDTGKYHTRATSDPGEPSNTNVLQYLLQRSEALQPLDLNSHLLQTLLSTCRAKTPLQSPSESRGKPISTDPRRLAICVEIALQAAATRDLSCVSLRLVFNRIEIRYSRSPVSANRADSGFVLPVPDTCGGPGSIPNRCRNGDRR